VGFSRAPTIRLEPQVQLSRAICNTKSSRDLSVRGLPRPDRFGAKNLRYFRQRLPDHPLADLALVTALGVVQTKPPLDLVPETSGSVLRNTELRSLAPTGVDSR
jgi:hypothetical protein